MSPSSLRHKFHFKCDLQIRPANPTKRLFFFLFFFRFFFRFYFCKRAGRKREMLDSISIPFVVLSSWLDCKLLFIGPSFFFFYIPFHLAIGVLVDSICLQFAVCSLQFAVCSLKSKVYSLQFTVYSLQWAVVMSVETLALPFKTKRKKGKSVLPRSYN